MRNIFILILIILTFTSCKKEEIELTGQLKVTFVSDSGQDIEIYSFYIYPYEVTLIEDRTKWGGNIIGGKTDENGIFLSNPLNPGNYVARYFNSSDPSSESLMTFQIIAGEVVEFNHYLD